MHSDGQSAGTCREIVSEESPLPGFIELAPRIQRQRAGRHDQPAVQRLMNPGFDLSGHGIKKAQKNSAFVLFVPLRG